MRRFESLLDRLPQPPQWYVTLPELVVPPALQPTPWHFSKVLSALLLVGALLAFGLMHSQDDWFIYREDVRFQNLIRLQSDDLYQHLEIDGLNIFWLEPATLRAALLTLPWIQDVQVQAGLPAALTLSITEQVPVALWVTSSDSYWVAADGATMLVGEPAASALPPVALPQIIDSLREAHAIGTGPLALDPKILAGALALVEALPELEGKVRYNGTVGLNFRLPEPEVWVYWGDGFDIETKLQNLAATRKLVANSETPTQILDLRFKDRPYIR
jgi:cell division protein FtsQ